MFSSYKTYFYPLINYLKNPAKCCWGKSYILSDSMDKRLDWLLPLSFSTTSVRSTDYSKMQSCPLLCGWKDGMVTRATERQSYSVKTKTLSALVSLYSSLWTPKETDCCYYYYYFIIIKRYLHCSAKEMNKQIVCNGREWRCYSANKQAIELLFVPQSF